MMTRSQSREQAFILLFEQGFHPDVSMEDLVALSLESGFIEESDFAILLANTALDHMQEINDTITQYAQGWSLDRITKVSLAILRLAVAEMKYVDDVPVGVSINEAVELAKRYATKEDSSFINGVLGSISRADA